MKLASTVIASSLLLGTAIGLFPGAASAVDNNGGVIKRANAVVGAVQPNEGHILCTAAINSDGSIATNLSGANSHIDPSKTGKLSTGTYQVGFAPPCVNVQIGNGWFRLVQPDTLGGGSLPATSCIVADRGGVPTALFVECYNSAGAATDTSFTVSVSR